MRCQNCGHENVDGVGKCTRCAAILGAKRVTWNDAPDSVERSGAGSGKAAPQPSPPSAPKGPGPTQRGGLPAFPGANRDGTSPWSPRVSEPSSKSSQPRRLSE